MFCIWILNDECYISYNWNLQWCYIKPCKHSNIYILFKKMWLLKMVVYPLRSVVFVSDIGYLKSLILNNIFHKSIFYSLKKSVPYSEPLHPLSCNVWHLEYYTSLYGMVSLLESYKVLMALYINHWSNTTMCNMNS
jgi:hypothetical protein